MDLTACPPPVVAALDDGSAARLVATAAADLAAVVPAVPVHTVVCAGRAGAALRDRSAGAAVLVVGRGTGAGGLGPVTRDLLGAATCPVPVVPPPPVRHHVGARERPAAVASAP